MRIVIFFNNQAHPKIKSAGQKKRNLREKYTQHGQQIEMILRSIEIYCVFNFFS